MVTQKESAEPQTRELRATEVPARVTFYQKLCLTQPTHPTGSHWISTTSRPSHKEVGRLWPFAAGLLGAQPKSFATSLEFSNGSKTCSHGFGFI